MPYLYYVIGASGVGKDSLMNYARATLNGSRPILFAHRYITRPPEVGNENHVHLSPEEFGARLAGGLFALHWGSHGQQYGIGSEIRVWLEAGFSVVVNGSREYLPEARKRFPELRVVLIEASPEVLKERLLARGRETAEEVEKRIARNQALEEGYEDVLRIRNDGRLEDAGQELIKLLTV